MKKLPLTQEMFALIDDEDFEKVTKYKWCADKYKDTWYAHRRVMKNKISRKIYLHRFILNAISGYDVDHINGNGLDNRRNNLRICTHKQNIINQKKRRDNTSGYKGVSLSSHHRYPQWRAHIVVDGKQKFLGYFSSPQQAYEARQLTEREYFGEFIRND